LLHNRIAPAPEYVSSITYGTVQLGQVLLPVDDFPSKLSFDGESQVVVKQYVGGTVRAQNLGPYDKQLSFKGTFRYIDPDTGTTALQRALLVDSYRVSGNGFTVTFPGHIQRQVVIQSFKYDIVNEYEVDYTLTLIPIDKAGSMVGATTTNADGSTTTRLGNSQVTVGSPSTTSQITQTTAVAPTTVPGSGSNKATTPTTMKKYVVQRGDTLWHIAAKFLGNGALYNLLYQWNNLTSSLIQPGETLLVPTNFTNKAHSRR